MWRCVDDVNAEATVLVPVPRRTQAGWKIHRGTQEIAGRRRTHTDFSVAVTSPSAVGIRYPRRGPPTGTNGDFPAFIS